jgi:hypothetical protein
MVKRSLMRPDPELTPASSPAASRRFRRWLLGLFAAALATLLLAPAAQADERIYWSNYATDSISWADLDGSGAGGTVNTAGATVDGPMGMALDPARGLVYWANWKGDTGTTISYARLDASTDPAAAISRSPAPRSPARTGLRSTPTPAPTAPCIGPTTPPTRSAGPSSTAPAAAPAAISRSRARPSTSRAG